MPAFKQLPVQTQDDLIQWFNIVDPDTYDKMRLATLAEDGLFDAWDCPDCGDRVYRGNPKNWDHFQGVLQVDHTTYPGSTERHTIEYLELMCDNCRMYDV